MAEVRKKTKVEKYNVDKMLEEKDKTKKKKTTKKKNTNNVKDIKKEEPKKKQSAWVRFRIFCHGVKSEFQKVFWPTKDNMVKYSITTILFVIFLALFFYLIDVIFALVQTLIG